jgi:hypothetical protein
MDTHVKPGHKLAYLPATAEQRILLAKLPAFRGIPDYRKENDFYCQCILGYVKEFMAGRDMAIMSYENETIRSILMQTHNLWKSGSKTSCVTNVRKLCGIHYIVVNLEQSGFEIDVTYNAYYTTITVRHPLSDRGYAELVRLL